MLADYGPPIARFAAKLQIAGLDISRSGVSKIEARLRYVDDRPSCSSPTC